MALTKIHKKCIGTHQLDIGLFYFYENFVIGEVKEGQNIDFECAKGLYELVERYYKNTIPYVYISNRIHSYSFKPTGHYKSSGLFTNLKGYGIITKIVSIKFHTNSPSKSSKALVTVLPIVLSLELLNTYFFEKTLFGVAMAINTVPTSTSPSPLFGPALPVVAIE